jgi:hypothetical protein
MGGERLMEANVDFDEKSLLKQIQKDFSKLSKVFEQVTKIKSNDLEALDKLEKAIKGMPNGETFSNAFKELKAQASKFLDEAKSCRQRNFGKIETEYLKQAKEKGKVIRESSKGWRIGALEIETRPELSKVRFLYNREVLINWQSVSNSENLLQVENNAKEFLEKASIQEELLTSVFAEAFTQSVQSNQANTNIVPMLKFYSEVRIALIKHFFTENKPNAKINKHIEFPRWAFLYNLDRYRAHAVSLPNQKRLGLQTGSQQEVSQGKGMVVNGLDPLQDYKVMCYVIGQVSK